jgi:hypothetical protein
LTPLLRRRFRPKDELVVDVGGAEAAPLLHPTLVRLGDGETELRTHLAALLARCLDEMRWREELWFRAGLDLGEVEASWLRPNF